MKTILLFSDSHGCTKAVNQLFQEYNLYDYIYFCGDGIDDIREYIYALPDKLEAVKGNCDSYFSNDPLQIITTCEGITFMITHGHKYHVKSGLDYLASTAKELGVNCVIFGHTHRQTDVEINGIRFINPGSLLDSNGKLSYGVLTVENKKIQFKQIKSS